MSMLAEKLDPTASQEAVVVPSTQAEVVPLRRVPRITIHAFCRSPELEGTLERAGRDRRMSRADLSVRKGGAAAALAAYDRTPSPDLLILESDSGRELLAELDTLAGVCDVGTRVMVIGSSNDIALYRELLKRGVSEYIQSRPGEMDVISAIAGIYADAGPAKLGRICAFIGARGGVGSSTIAHNVAWTIARFNTGVILADMDLPFGTAALNFNLEPSHGIVEAVRDSGRLDETMLDRLLTKCGDHLSLLSAPGLLDHSYDLAEDVFEQVLDLAQSVSPYTVLDLPHIWTGWARKTLLAADEVVITTTPDLAGMRNAKNLTEMLRQARPNDAPPRLVLNQLNAPKRPEIEPGEFADLLQLEHAALIPYEPKVFGQAAITGQMLGEVAGGKALAASIDGLARTVSGRGADGAGRSGLRRVLQRLAPARRSR